MYYGKEHNSPNSPCSEPENDVDDLFRSKVQVLWQEECFVDVTLACDDKLLTAHKLVLSAYSDYFKNLFSSIRFNQYPVVFMKDVSHEILQAILEFMYCGEVNVAQYNLKAFMKMANTLKVKGLAMNDDNPVQEEPSGKRRRQGSMIEKQMMTSSPPLKKKKIPVQYHHSDFEDKYDEEEMGELRLEEEEEMVVHHRMNQKPQKQRPQPLSASRHADTSNQRKRNNSPGNSSISSQHSRTSLSKPSSVKSKPQQEPIIKRGKPSIRENLNPEPVSEPGFSDCDDPTDSNMLSDDAMEEPNESFSKSFQKSIPKSQSRMSSDSAQDEIRRSANPVVKPQPQSAKARIRSTETLFANPEHEEKLVKFVSYMSQITPLTCNQVKAFAWGIDSVLGENLFGQDGPTKNWWSSFRKKHANINRVLRSYDFLKEENLPSEMFSFRTLGDYLIPIQEIIEAFDLNEKPENFWSCGEYTINLSSHLDNCMRPSRERFLGSAHFPPDGEFVSILLAGSASGQKVSPFTVFKNIAPDDDFTKNGALNGVYDQNSTGFTDSMLLMKWFEDCFLPQCPKTRSEDNPVVLLLNSCFPLVPTEMLDLALTENVILLSLMPHLHHACQPMDAPFVWGFRKALKGNIIANGGTLGEELKDSLPSLMKDPFEKGVTSELIKAGFRICGVFPLAVNVKQDDYLGLRSQLAFDGLVTTSLKKGKVQPVSEKPNPARKSKLIQIPSQEATTSDEEEQFDDTSACYVCGKDFPKEGITDVEGKWFKCAKRHCKNYSCEECLPLNYEKTSDYICIDCNR